MFQRCGRRRSASRAVDAKVAEIKKAIDTAYADLDRKEGAVKFDDEENKDTISVELARL
jgi:hypothetical protein